ncbi:glucose-6-phosphate dehydrogenase [Gephyromycinifex aptenodytis]|uniref:glucose-6-phosphate dehydrogenase n=1 Tax=Gephyromycinifex aptenodytis TaxID=2716227 RepID=UPI0014488293|nr:glucose-6-phosphate dehydrogenase [Gephyromycinifex aptenodytis]
MPDRSTKRQQEAADRVPTLVILGATSDLVSRLLLPGLGSLLAAEPARRVNVVGVGRRPFEGWNDIVRTSLSEAGVEADCTERTVQAARYLECDVTDPDQLPGFVADLPPDAVLYFALPPSVTMKVVAQLADLPLPEGLRLGLEKPFGEGLESAREFNRVLAGVLPEERIHRIDHFFGDSTVLNILGFRFANRLFQPVWNNQNIERVDIVADEKLALEGRAGYYDTAGALVDMIQSHLLLVFAMTTMEEPTRMDPVELHDLMSHTLRATQVRGADGAAASRRARYSAGSIEGKDVPAYVDEEGVDPDNETETLAEVDLEIRNSRWAGVPFTLRSGKALSQDRRRIVVTFKAVDHLMEGFGNTAPRNRIIIDMKPDQVLVEVATNGARNSFCFDQTVLDARIEEASITPYGEILAGVLDGDPLLSIRADLAEECWRVLAPVLQAWEEGKVPMQEYPAGSDGPDWDAA